MGGDAKYIWFLILPNRYFHNLVIMSFPFLLFPGPITVEGFKKAIPSHEMDTARVWEETTKDAYAREVSSRISRCISWSGKAYNVVWFLLYSFIYFFVLYIFYLAVHYSTNPVSASCFICICPQNKSVEYLSLRVL